jgi:LPS-assembly lipoprotein
MNRGLGLGAALGFALACSGCTLQPLYSGGGRGQVAQALRSVAVAPIPGRAG